MLRVGLHENIFILFLLAIKTAGSAQKLRVGRVSGNTAIFCLRLIIIINKNHFHWDSEITISISISISISNSELLTEVPSCHCSL